MPGYETRAPLADRLSLYAFQRDRVDLPGEALRLLADARGPVLDVGCGLGQYVDRLGADRPDLRVFGLDRSEAMARHLRADADRMPIADSSCGAALAMHMLYHVPDITRALRELRRVVRPSGVVLASTNGPRDKQELYDVVTVAIRAAGHSGGDPYVDPARRFCLDDDAPLRAVFDHVEAHAWVRETVVPTAGPVVAFIESMNDGPSWPDVVREAERLVEAVIASTGAFALTSEVGIFVCR